MNIDIDDVIYPQLIISFPAEDAEEILEIIEDLKGDRGIDNPSELEQEVWQRYLSLRAKLGLPAPGSQPPGRRTEEQSGAGGGGGSPSNFFT